MLWLVQSYPNFSEQKQTSMVVPVSSAVSFHLKNQTVQVECQALQYRRFMTFLYGLSPLSSTLIESKEPNQAI